MRKGINIQLIRLLLENVEASRPDDFHAGREGFLISIDGDTLLGILEFAAEQMEATGLGMES